MMIAVLMIGATAQARSLMESYSADLTKFEFQEETSLSAFAHGREVTGTVYVTPSSQIALTLNSNCPMGQVCTLEYREPLTFDVPVTSIEKGFCNETVYVGQVDARPVDGNLTKITVVDNRQNHCKMFVAPTEVILDIDGGGRGHQAPPERHYMEGNEFQFSTSSPALMM